MCSDLTFFYKYIFSSIWIAGFGIGSIIVYSTDKVGVGIFPVWILGSVFCYLVCCRIKKVSINPVNNKVYISNFIKEIEVPFADVENISGSLFLTPELVFIKFKVATEFGRTVIFMPKIRLFGGYSEHPIVQWLKQIVLHR